MKKLCVGLMGLILFFSGCETPDEINGTSCQYGNIVFQYDSEMDGVYFGGACSGAEINNKVFFIPEKIYGLNVVGISHVGRGDINSKIIVVPKSVVKEISICSSCYEKLETLVILSEESFTSLSFKYLNGSFSPSPEELNTIILCAKTPPTELSFKNDCVFYVPDKSLYLYQKAYPRHALYFFPISEYSGNLSLSKFNIDKPNWNYEIEMFSPSWYYYDVYTKDKISIILTNGVFRSKVYPVSGENLYLNFVYKPNTIICDLEISSEDDKPVIFPEPKDNYSRIYVYSETPVKIVTQSSGSYTFPGYEMTKIN